jgi:hypothetical protein
MGGQDTAVGLGDPGTGRRAILALLLKGVTLALGLGRICAGPIPGTDTVIDRFASL